MFSLVYFLTDSLLFRHDQRAWPVRVVPRPEPVYNADAIAPSAEGKYTTLATLTPNVRNNVEDYKNDVFPPHQMTGVDKLHERGVLGQGVRVSSPLLSLRPLIEAERV